jgi:signal transduction histidine kinase
MQVLLGLQSNALKFTTKGNVTIIAEIYQEETKENEKEGDRYLKMSVQDSGIGIKEVDKKKLFQLFGFVKDTQQLNQNGVGLGLVISEQIVG